MEKERTKGIVEFLLFASEKPISVERIAGIFDDAYTKEELYSLLDELRTEISSSESRGVKLEEVAGGWQFRTKEDNQTWIKKLENIKPIRVSPSALEVLAIIAYKQPITKTEADKIRGVDSTHIFKTLMDKDLVRICGRADLPGRPLLYSTTPEFLEVFGLKEIRELPSITEIEDMVSKSFGDSGDYRTELNESLRLIVDEKSNIEIVDDGLDEAEKAMEEMQELGKELKVDIDLVQEKVDIVFEDACRKYATHRQKNYQDTSSDTISDDNN